MKSFLLTFGFCAVALPLFAQTTGRIPTTTTTAPVIGLSPGAVTGLTPGQPVTTPAPVSGFNSGVVGGFTPQAAGPITQNPAGGFTPAPVTGINPGAVGGMLQNPVTVVPNLQPLTTNPVTGLTPVLPIVPDTNVTISTNTVSPF